MKLFFLTSQGLKLNILLYQIKMNIRFGKSTTQNWTFHDTKFIINSLIDPTYSYFYLLSLNKEIK